MYTYKNKKTGKITTRKTPMPRDKAQDYVLVGWIRNMMIKAQNVIKK
jgi:hypothetical protein